MRYYFHLKSQNQILRDHNGIHIDDSGALRSAVLGALAEICGQVPGVLDHLGEWNLAVCTSLEEEVFSIPLRKVSLAAAELGLVRRLGMHGQQAALHAQLA